MVRGWKFDLRRMVKITTFEVGKVCVALMATRVTDSATRSCCALRSFVPTWMMMWLGSPKFSLISCFMALSVFGHQSFNVLWPGKCFSLMNLPFESIKMITSAFCRAISCSWGPSEASVCDVGGGGAAAGLLDFGVRVWAAVACRCV